MENKLRKNSRCAVRLATMPENQLFQVTELVNGEIRGQSSLHSFLANDTNAHISFQYHANIITSIADGCNPLSFGESLK